MIDGAQEIARALTPWLELLMRIAVGAAVLPHGLRACCGWFTEPGRPSGFRAMAAHMEESGFRPGALAAAAALAAIFVAGPLLVLGLCTRLAALAQFAFLVLCTVHHARIGGWFCNRNGLEYPLLWSIATLYFVGRGGGPLSLDAWLLGTPPV